MDASVYEATQAHASSYNCMGVRRHHEFANNSNNSRPAGITKYLASRKSNKMKISGAGTYYDIRALRLKCCGHAEIAGRNIEVSI